jgi:hypothetical protein
VIRWFEDLSFLPSFLDLCSVSQFHNYKSNIDTFLNDVYIPGLFEL